MAANCRRVVSLLRRSWSSVPASRSQLGYCLTSSCRGELVLILKSLIILVSFSEVPSSRLPVCVLSSSVCPRHRHLTTKAVDTAHPTSTEPVDKEEPGLLTRFWRWLNDEEEEYVSIRVFCMLSYLCLYTSSGVDKYTLARVQLPK